MSLPPIAPPLPAAAAPRPLLPRTRQRQQQQTSPSAGAASKKASTALAATAKAPRKSRAAGPPERPGAFSSSWPSAPLARHQVPRSRGAQQERRAAALPPQPAASGASSLATRGRSVLPTTTAAAARSARPCGNLNPAVPEGRGEAALRFSLNLPPDAIRVLQRRSLEKQQQQRGRTPYTASPSSGSALKRPLAAAGDLHALLQVSLLNEHHRYDDVEYEEDEAAAPAGGPATPAADEGLVRKCTEWLRGVEKATARDRGADKLGTLPHLSSL